MQEHDEICVCFHVSIQKIQKFVRLNKPKIPTQISECYGAGTGCGWCIPFLEKIFEAEKNGEPLNLKMSREEYLQRRLAYHKKKKIS
ncbi:MAG: (2Fe-2S)-binding protein [Candidatus Omnitrophica bacterium]|nr:MAG: BFD-like (2Fe-2S) binding domain protein [Candidatus Hinthialibacteria bacterium OLB16]MBE7489030.1 (2Fe-2S)-binding protein [bacterium]MCC6733542.1 (2Fe-2S)-binding protein [Candidatus Omnitrophota bacterium]MBV6482146.1 hypothetical protein [bacterium]MCK6497741.1 (2Fe-2S)-binding protein [bacterium]